MISLFVRILGERSSMLVGVDFSRISQSMGSMISRVLTSTKVLGNIQVVPEVLEHVYFCDVIRSDVLISEQFFQSLTSFFTVRSGLCGNSSCLVDYFHGQNFIPE